MVELEHYALARLLLEGAVYRDWKKFLLSWVTFPLTGCSYCVEFEFRRMKGFPPASFVSAALYSTRLEESPSYGGKIIDLV